MRYRSLACLTALIGTSACSIHPIPFEAPGYNTVDIVRQIRCEAAKAIEKHVLLGLKEGERARYVKAAIVYRYNFNVTENNDASASTGFSLPVTGGTFTLGLTAGAERERAGTRELVVTDSFVEALDELYTVEK